MPFDQFPWFRKGTIEQISEVQWPTADHLSWPALDIDLSVQSLRNPSAFPPVTGNAFRDDDFSHEQVFGHLQQEPFSAWEAAEYLEVSVPTLRRYVQSGKLVPSHVVGRNQMFAAQTLRAFKRTRN